MAKFYKAAGFRERPSVIDGADAKRVARIAARYGFSTV